MKYFSIVPVLAAFFLVDIFSPAHCVALSLSLEDAIKKAYAESPEITAARADADSLRAQRNQIYSEYLPRVSVGRRFQQQKSRYHLGHPSQRTGIHEDRVGYHYVDIEADFENPFKFYERLNIAAMRLQVANYKLQAAELKVDAAVKVQYFAAVIAEHTSTNAQKNLDVAKNDFDIVTRRFRGGYIHSSDLKRSEISFLRRTANLRTSTQKKIQENTKLLLLLGVSPDDAADLKLISPLPKTFPFERIEAEELTKLLLNPASLEQKLGDQSVGIAERELRVARLGYFPDISLTASFRKSFERQSAFVDPAGPLLILSADWELFSGGRSFFEVSEAQARLASLIAQKKSKSRDDQEASLSGVKKLINLQSDIRTQRDSLKMLEEIFAASRQRFASGLIDSKQVNDDFRDYLEQEAELLNTSLEIIRTAAELDERFERLGIFAKLIHDHT
jgi:outer membrane protein TolC